MPEMAMQIRRLRGTALGLLLIWLGAEGAAGLGLANSPLLLFRTANGVWPYLLLVLAALFYFFYWIEPDRRALAVTGLAGLGLTGAAWLVLRPPVLAAPLPLRTALFLGLGA